MIINRRINIDDDKLSNGLSEVLGIIDQIYQSPDAEDTIDFSRTRFVSPTFILPLLIFINGTGKTIHTCNLTEYMHLLHFGNGGLNSDSMRKTEFIAHMERYSKGRYIPMIHFPATANRVDDKNEILTTIESILSRQVGLMPNVTMGLKYMIGEIVDNITEHSQSERGYIFAQSYPTKGYMDICIGDTGITLAGSYANLPGNEIESDLEAIQAANRGISTKNLPDAENRGYGITTSRQMLIDGLNGQYIMLSGNAVYIRNRTIDKFVILPNNIRCKGTIVAFRIPYINQDFQYIRYIE